MGIRPRVRTSQLRPKIHNLKSSHDPCSRLAMLRIVYFLLEIGKEEGNTSSSGRQRASVTCGTARHAHNHAPTRTSFVFFPTDSEGKYHSFSSVLVGVIFSQVNPGI